MVRFISEEPGFQAYVRACERYPLLDRQQEHDLARRFRENGSRAAADSLVESHLRSVVKIAYKYRGYGIYLSDLAAEGNLGLLEAVRRFDPDRGLRFLTYARYWIRAYMLAHILKHWSIVDLGTSALQSKMFFRLQAEHARLIMELGGEDTTIETRLADKFKTSVANVRTSLQRLGRRDTSLDAPIGPDGNVRMVDLLASTGVNQEQQAAAAEMRAMVQGALAEVRPMLDARELTILDDRLFPGEVEPRTLQSLGGELGVTRERVRQIEVQLKRKLQKAVERRSQAEPEPVPA